MTKFDPMTDYYVNLQIFWWKAEPVQFIKARMPFRLNNLNIALRYILVKGQ